MNKNITKVQGQDARIQINREAPAVETADVFIKAPIETVWSVLSDLGCWPSWNPGVSKIKVNGPVKVGTSFEWVAGKSKLVSRIKEMNSPRRIAWSGKTLGIRAMHVWELAEKGEGTQVHTEESFEGLVARLFRGFAKKTLTKALTQGVSSLKAEVESR
jgi:carbon monoxide dehydrogenase subunit G